MSSLPPRPALPAGKGCTLPSATRASDLEPPPMRHTLKTARELARGALPPQRRAAPAPVSAASGRGGMYLPRGRRRRRHVARGSASPSPGNGGGAVAGSSSPQAPGACPHAGRAPCWLPPGGRWRAGQRRGRSVQRMERRGGVVERYREHRQGRLLLQSSSMC